MRVFAVDAVDLGELVRARAARRRSSRRVRRPIAYTHPPASASSRTRRTCTFTRQTFVWSQGRGSGRRTPRRRRSASGAQEVREVAGGARRSSVSISATPSSKSRPLAGEDFLLDRGERIEPVQNGHVPRYSSRSTTACVRALVLVPDGALPVEARPGAPSVVEGYLPGFVERAGRGDPDESAVHRPARERRADDLIALRGELKERSVGVPSRRGRSRRSSPSRSSCRSSRGGWSSAHLKCDPRAPSRTRRSRRRAGTRPRRASPS